MAESEAVGECFCGKTFEKGRFMIQCDVCKDWFHGTCVAIKEYQTMDLEKYHCPQCEPLCGPSILRQRNNLHRHNPCEFDADQKPVQAGTPVFIKELRSRHFPSADDVIIRLRGQQLTLPYLMQNGLNEPIIVENKDGLGLILPPDSFTVHNVEDYVGSEKEVDVIDVMRQSIIRMTLHDFVEYYTGSSRTNILNCVSLEFSETSLAALVEPPYIVKKLCWVENSWPKDLPEDLPFSRPKVQKYCLMSVKDSYTDFHVDFGGTSVWYHMFKGEKIFYLVKPTSANLSLYHRWMQSSNQSETFFGDQADCCFKLVLRPGQTLVIPTGWIHAVLTPVDSMAFGGNFLHSLAIPLQLQVHEIELKLKTPLKYKFPAFEAANWFGAKRVFQELRDMNETNVRCPKHILEGAKTLLNTLRVWLTAKEINKPPRLRLPDSIQNPRLLKDIAKEIRHAERYLHSLNPPKPERESKRHKRKPPGRDYSEISKTQEEIQRSRKNSNSKNLSNKSGPIKLEASLDESLENKVVSPLKLTIPKEIHSNLKCPTVEPTLESSKSSFKLEENPPGSLVVRLKSQSAVYKRFKDGDSCDGNPTFKKAKTSDEYDFNNTNNDDDCEDDDDDDEYRLKIEEHPKKKTPKSHPLLKLRLSLGNKQPMGSDTSSESSSLHNGIEELLRASGYTDDVNDENSSGRTSPSTREAIVGMLTMSTAVFSQQQIDVKKANEFSRDVRDSSGSKNNNDDDGLNDLYQDDEYVYPSLELSDEEEKYASRAKHKKGIVGDQAWNPTARVRLPVPRSDRPHRCGTKRPALAKCLGKSAVKDEDTDLSLMKKDIPKKKLKKENVTLWDDPTEGASSIPSPTSPSVSSLPSVNPTIIKRPKKGMATAKQRLGKILKLHKMLY